MIPGPGAGQLGRLFRGGCGKAFPVRPRVEVKGCGETGPVPEREAEYGRCWPVTVNKNAVKVRR